MVPEPAGMYIWSIHLHPHAGEPTHLVWLHVAFSHQPYQNLILQVPFLAAQTIGKCQSWLKEVIVCLNTVAEQ